MYVQKTWTTWTTLIISSVTAFFLDQNLPKLAQKPGQQNHKGVDKNATSTQICRSKTR